MGKSISDIHCINEWHSINEWGFPIRVSKGKSPQHDLTIVSACPKCGAPIYGSHLIQADSTPVVKFSCVCSGSSDNLTGVARTT